MKKRLNLYPVCRAAAAVLLFAICFLAAAGNAMAETKQENLFYNDTVQSRIVWISYETDDVTIALVDPDGNVIDPLDEDSGCNIFVGDTSMLIVIPDAKEGQWMLSYDKGSNESLDVQVGTYEEPIWITEFTLDGISEDELQVTFQADYDGDLTYRYIIYLTTDTQGGAGKELASGSAPANEEQQVRVDLSSVNTYDAYYLRLYVYYTKDDLEYFDDAYTDSFSFTSPETADPIEDVEAEVDEATNSVTFDWSNYIPYGVDGAYIIVEADGTTVEEAYVDRDDATDLTVSLDDDANEVTVRISVRYSNGQVSEDLEKTIELNPSDSGTQFLITFPDSGKINTLSASYEYENADDQEVTITLNDVAETVLLSGGGTGYLTLQDGSNIIEYSYFLEDSNIIWHGTVYLVVDRIAPTITLFEDYDGSQTENDSVIITGLTDTDATLTIGGETVDVSESGSFSHTVALAEGINEIEILAQDDAGNIANHTILINRSTGSTVLGTLKTDSKIWSLILTWLPLILAVGASVLLIILLLIVLSVKKRKRGLPGSVRMFSVYFMILSFLGTAAGLIVWFLRHSYIRSDEFIEYAYYYADEAYDYLTWTNLCLRVGIVCLVIFIVSLLLTIFMTWLNSKMPAIQAKRQEKEAAKQQAKEAEERRQAEAEAEAERMRQAEEAARAERMRQAQMEAEAARARQAQMAAEAEKKRQAQMAAEAERKRQAQMAAEAERKRLAETEAARRRQAEAEAEAEKKRLAEAEAEAEKKRQTEAEAEKKQLAENEPVKMTARFCGNCGAKLAPNTLFCGNCGQKV